MCRSCAAVAATHACMPGGLWQQQIEEAGLCTAAPLRVMLAYGCQSESLVTQNLLAEWTVRTARSGPCGPSAAGYTPVTAAWSSRNTLAALIWIQKCVPHITSSPITPHAHGARDQPAGAGRPATSVYRHLSSASSTRPYLCARSSRWAKSYSTSRTPHALRSPLRLALHRSNHLTLAGMSSQLARPERLLTMFGEDAASGREADNMLDTAAAVAAAAAAAAAGPRATRSGKRQQCQPRKRKRKLAGSTAAAANVASGGGSSGSDNGDVAPQQHAAATHAAQGQQHAAAAAPPCKRQRAPAAAAAAAEQSMAAAPDKALGVFAAHRPLTVEQMLSRVRQQQHQTQQCVMQLGQLLQGGAAGPTGQLLLADVLAPAAAGSGTWQLSGQVRTAGTLLLQPPLASLLTEEEDEAALLEAAEQQAEQRQPLLPAVAGAHVTVKEQKGEQHAHEAVEEQQQHQQHDGRRQKQQAGATDSSGLASPAGHYNAWQWAGRHADAAHHKQAVAEVEPRRQQLQPSSHGLPSMQQAATQGEQHQPQQQLSLKGLLRELLIDELPQLLAEQPQLQQQWRQQQDEQPVRSAPQAPPPKQQQQARPPLQMAPPMQALDSTDPFGFLQPDMLDALAELVVAKIGARQRREQQQQQQQQREQQQEQQQREQQRQQQQEHGEPLLLPGSGVDRPRATAAASAASGLPRLSSFPTFTSFLEWMEGRPAGSSLSRLQLETKGDTSWWRSLGGDKRRASDYRKVLAAIEQQEVAETVRLQRASTSAFTRGAQALDAACAAEGLHLSAFFSKHIKAKGSN